MSPEEESAVDAVVNAAANAKSERSMHGSEDCHAEHDLPVGCMACNRCGMAPMETSGRYWPGPCPGTLEQELASLRHEENMLRHRRAMAFKRRGMGAQ